MGGWPSLAPSLPTAEAAIRLQRNLLQPKAAPYLSVGVFFSGLQVPVASQANVLELHCVAAPGMLLFSVQPCWVSGLQRAI